MKSTLVIIGAGNMGAALCKGLLKSLPQLSLAISDRHAEKLKQFSGVRTSLDPKEILGNADHVLIAVKPQSFDELCSELGDLLKNKLVISIMAGKTLKTLAEKTGSGRVVRSMPNLGAQVSYGMTAWIASPDVTSGEAESVRKIFQAVGKEIRMKKEEDIEHFSVIAGCGPAYFFRLCSVLAREAEALGFSEEESMRMAMETFIGSAKLLELGTRTPDEWVKAVASKGGVTEAALKHLAESDTDAVMKEAIEKSLQRSREL